MDETSDLSCKDSTRQYPADGSPLSCNSRFRVEFSSPSRVFELDQSDVLEEFRVDRHFLDLPDGRLDPKLVPL